MASFASIKRAACYLLYYGIARKLPRSYELSVVGRYSSKLRSLLCRGLFRECRGNFMVERGADFGSGKNIIMHENACIGENARFMGRGTFIFGKHSMMGPDVLLVNENHKFTAETFDGYDVGQITVGEHAWIGARAVLLKDVTVGRYAIVGSGAVVSKSIPDYGIAVGNPAKVVKYRNQSVAQQAPPA